MEATPPASALPRQEARIASALGWLREAAALGRARFSSSFGAEDMVLLDLIARERLPVEIFTLDTGRLHEETYRLMARVEERYGRIVRSHFPDATALQALVARQGVNGFYESVEQRKACCRVRKVEPLQRALAGADAWITGQRAAQSTTRERLAPREHDPDLPIEKFNPLHDWSELDVWTYLHAHEVPTNELHARFFPSIGCAPCTRAVSAGEDIRAGRWWWEQPASRECGLHARGAGATPRPATAEPHA
jgi:phosphoadenosine phosphosulfate reductase